MCRHDSEKPWVAEKASAGSKQFAVEYPNTSIENGRLDFPNGTYLVLGPNCQGVVFKRCTLAGAAASPDHSFYRVVFRCRILRAWDLSAVS